MARTLTIPPHLPIAELERRYRAAQDPVARSHWQIVWLLARGQPTAAVAAGTSSSVNWVREIARRSREDGPGGLGDRRHTTPGAAPLLDAGQQERLRLALGGTAPDGGLWTGRQVAAWMSAQLARPVSEQRGWEDVRKLGLPPSGRAPGPLVLIRTPKRRSTRGAPSRGRCGERGVP